MEGVPPPVVAAAEMERADLERRLRELKAMRDFSKNIASGLVKDFFTHRHWENRIPKAWREPLRHADSHTLSRILTQPNVSGTTEVWPLSLLAFIAASHALRLKGSTSQASSSHDVDAFTLGNALRRAVNPKKMHEIERLTALTDSIARAVDCDSIVDIGSGKGYLPRALAYGRGWPVVGVEALEHNVERATHLDEKIKSLLLKKQRDCLLLKGGFDRWSSATCQFKRMPPLALQTPLTRGGKRRQK